MKSLVLTVLGLVGWTLAAQNLVPNPGFDDLTDCPSEGGQIYYAEPWVTASNGTPDLLNTCSTAQFIQVPYAGSWIDSYQLPRSGNGYAYIMVYFNANVAFIANSEYLEVSLKEPLKAGKNYYIEFYVSPDITPTRYWGFTDAVGLALSDTFYYRELNTREVLPIVPVVENRGTVISDTSNWTRISGCHTARGGEKFAIIGNFRSPQETLVEFVTPSYPFVNYFYIEDVLIQAFDPLPDTLLLCDGQVKTLNAAFLDAAYHWNTGETDSVIFVQNAGVYTVEAIMEKCVLRDTVVVLDTRGNGSFPKDSVICQDEPLTLSAPIVGEYIWSDGSDKNSLIVQNSGIYEVTVTNECGQFAFTTKVEAENCACNIYVPNAISPNGDGINDELRVFVGCDFQYRILQFNLFDRWGAHVYAAQEGDAISWDGRYKGKPAPDGIYAWFIEYEVTRNGAAERYIKSGDVSVVK